MQRCTPTPSAACEPCSPRMPASTAGSSPRCVTDRASTAARAARSRPPKAANMRFYPTAAAAQHAGFRACKRCRPDATPGSPEWNVRADVVARAMRLIADGVVDREGVPGLAGRLGYSARQIERLLLAEVGAGPLALARAQRAQTARLLIETTDLPMADVAFAAGLRQHPPVQRHRPGRVRAHPRPQLRHARRRPPRSPGGPAALRAAAAVPPAVLPRQPLRPPGRDGRPRRRGVTATVRTAARCACPTATASSR